MNDRTLRDGNLEVHPLDDQRLDQLVDGTLDLPEQRKLLTQLDRTPDGWRRCALAFVEAQAWRNEFRQFHGETDRFMRNPVPRTDASAIANRRSPASRVIGRLVGMALALSVAFGLGRISRPVSPPLQDEVVEAPDRSPILQPDDEQVVTKEPLPETPSDAHEPGSADGIHVAARLSWQLQQDGQERRVEVPVLEGRGLDMEWVMQQPTAVQESICKALERRGHKVETQRQLLTVNLKDGRSVVVPIDQVQVKFAKRMFQ